MRFLNSNVLPHSVDGSVEQGSRRKSVRIGAASVPVAAEWVGSSKPTSTARRSESISVMILV